MAQLTFSDDGKHAIFTQSHKGIMVSTTKDKGHIEKKQPIKEGQEGEKLAKWGEDNLRPQWLETKIRQNELLASTLDRQSRLLYGGGVVYGTIEGYDEEGKEKFTPSKPIPEIDEFLRRLQYSQYFTYSCHAFYRFFNIFPSLILSANRKKIHTIIPNKTTYCRWGKENNRGVKEKCYLSANWENDPVLSKCINIAVLDKMIDPITALKEGAEMEYIYPVTYPTENHNYAWAPWESMFESGWYDVAMSIPKFKKAMFLNQISIKYHIQIHERWWIWKYPDFEDVTIEKRHEYMKNEQKSFQKVMVGEEKALMTLMTTDFYDSATQSHIPGWKITAIDDKVKSDTYIEDGKEANQNLLYALGFDPAIVGSAPGNMTSSGSGTDKEAAIKIHLKSCQIHQDTVLEPVKFAFEFNGFPELVPRFRHSLTSTANKAKEKTQEIN